MSGRFIVIEGADGAGKSSIVKTLCELLTDQGQRVCSTREPGGTVLAEALRKVLLSDAAGAASQTTQALIMAASRRSHVEDFIRPRLAEGTTVICDRFYLSTLYYQPDAEMGDELIALGMSNTFPDITIVLDVDYDVSRERLHQRNGDANHFDVAGKEVFEARRQIMLDYATGTAQHVVIDANGTFNETMRAVLHAIGADRPWVTD